MHPAVDATYFDGCCPCLGELFPDETPVFKVLSAKAAQCPSRPQQMDGDHARVFVPPRPWQIAAELDAARVDASAAEARPLSFLPAAAL